MIYFEPFGGCCINLANCVSDNPLPGKFDSVDTQTEIVKSLKALACGLAPCYWYFNIPAGFLCFLVSRTLTNNLYKQYILYIQIKKLFVIINSN